MKTVGLALGGGGARGIAHIAVLEALDLRGEHRQVRLFGLALSVCRHPRDHPGKHVEE